MVRMTTAAEIDVVQAFAPDAVPLRTVRVATYNIHGAVGTDLRFSPERILEVVREIDADIIALQEVPLGGGVPNVCAILQSALDLEAVEGATRDSRGRRFGNAVLSRLPIVATRSIDLSFGSREPRGAVDADVDCGGRVLRVVATHLGLSSAERLEQVRRLLGAFDTAEVPVMLLGDVNEWLMWGRPLRRLIAHFRKVPAPATFPAFLPFLALDRIWIRPRDRLVRVDVHATPLARRASDHLPLVAQIAR